MFVLSPSKQTSLGLRCEIDLGGPDIAQAVSSRDVVEIAVSDAYLVAQRYSLSFVGPFMI